MSHPSETLVPVPHPTPPPGPLAVPPPPSFGFAFAPPMQQTEEPSFLWRTITRHFKLLVGCGLVSIAIAYLAGVTFGKPTWQAETTLLYQMVPLTPQQLAVYQDPPNIITLSNMVCEPAVIEQLAREFNFTDEIDDFLLKKVRVNQPNSTQLLTISVNWNDRETVAAMTDRLADLFADHVVVQRKEAILRKALMATRQALAISKNEIGRYQRLIRDLEAELARTGRLPEGDPDGSLAIRKGTLMDDIKRSENYLEEYYSTRAKTVKEIDRIRPLVKQGGIPQYELRDRMFELEILELRIKQAKEKIQDAREEIRTLPIVMARGKMFAEEARAKDAEDQIGRLQQDLVNVGRPGGPPAKGLLEGMDAREFIVKAPARTADKPTASTKKSIAVYTFLGLMGCVMGLALAYDYFVPPPNRPAPRRRASDRADDGATRANLVRVERRDGRTEKVTIAQVESPRLTVRIDQWIKAPDPSSMSLPALTIGPDGQVEDRTVTTETEARHMADRIHQWLEKGPFDPPESESK